MDIDIDKLEAAARAIAPGMWSERESVAPVDWEYVILESGKPIAHTSANRASFIAYASPSVVLELIERLRAADVALHRLTTGAN